MKDVIEHIENELWKRDGVQDVQICPIIVDLQDADDEVNDFHSHCSNMHDDDTDTDYDTVSESDDEDNDLCTICKSRDPPSTSRDDLNSTVKWSQCDYCDMWVHDFCCGFDSG